MTKPTSSARNSHTKKRKGNWKLYLEAPFPRVALHPASLRHIRQGHPWITSDEFTKKFPGDRLFLIGTDPAKKELCLLLNDPAHPKIKARVWSHSGDFIQQVKDFPMILRERLIRSFQKRRDLQQLGERENICLCYGEADFLPGLQILLFKDFILIQNTMKIWDELSALLKKNLEPAFKDVFPDIELKGILYQTRNAKQELSLSTWFGPERAKQGLEIAEFGVKYDLRLDRHYDFGLYTDMASIRKKMRSWFKEKTVLNLYCYTGSFSLFALKQGAKSVTSVDLSPEYLTWLEQNLQLNPGLDGSKNLSVQQSVEKYLKTAVKEEKKFDVIICDPPSASSDGKKMSNALKQYEQTLPLMLELLSKKGKLVTALNTHQIPLKKFSEKIKGLLDPKKFKIQETWTNDDDFQGLKNVPENQYLKVIVIVPVEGRA